MHPRATLAAALSLSAVFTAALCGLFAVASIAVYDHMSEMVPACGGSYAGQTPAAFVYGNVDVRPYLMAQYEDVTLRSRDDGVAISAWFVPGAGPESPAVVVVHGMEACKQSSDTLIAAGLLHRAGFAVLLIDLRDEGASQVVTAHGAYGAVEYRDVLGAWDWLRGRGVDAAKIGLYGRSLGGATVLVAAAREPGVAAVWSDSGYADVEATISYQAARRLRPSILGAMLVLGGRLRGVEITAPSALDLASSARGRAVAVVHGDADANVPVAEALRLAAAYRTAGATIETWIVPGVGHCGAMPHDLGDYERRLTEFFRRSLAA